LEADTEMTILALSARFPEPDTGADAEMETFLFPERFSCSGSGSGLSQTGQRCFCPRFIPHFGQTLPPRSRSCSVSVSVLSQIGQRCFCPRFIPHFGQVLPPLFAILWYPYHFRLNISYHI
jgi:hypothetical protein